MQPAENEEQCMPQAFSARSGYTASEETCSSRAVNLDNWLQWQKTHVQKRRRIQRTRLNPATLLRRKQLAATCPASMGCGVAAKKG